MTEKSDLEGLTILGHDAKPERRLEAFANRHPERPYVVSLATEEFTCLCPVTGQPDFARITVDYVPGDRIVESKSFKLYLWSYRDEGVFHEHVVNRILDDLVAAIAPRWCRVTGNFAARGGIAITVTADHGKRGDAA